MIGGRGKSRFSLSRTGAITGSILLWLFASLIAYQIWVHGADHRDFYPRWAGTRLVIEGTDDLYSEDTTNRIQQALYGHEIPANQDQQGFAYPGLILPLILPFCLLEDVEIATSVWIGFSFILLVITLHNLLSNRWESYLPGIFFLSIWPYTVLSLFQGQVSCLVLASLGLGYVSFLHRRYLLGGLLLSVSLIKPELIVLPIFILLYINNGKSRLKAIIGLALGGSILFAISILMIGWWVPDWISSLPLYASYAQVAWIVVEANHLHPILSVGLILAAILIFIVLRNQRDMLFASSIPLQLLMFPQTLLWCLTLLGIPLAIIFRYGSKLPIYLISILGWCFLLLKFGSSWWKLQIGILSLVSLILILYVGLGERKKPVTKEL
jgi:hypothetical protein